jgi:predicted protein tyrosine phosphatase
MPNPQDKYLCICAYGHSRSVCLTRVLHELDRVAVAIGWSTAGDALPRLCEWADKILVIDQHANHRIPQEHKGKVVNFDVGPDRWVNPYSQDLHTIFKKMVQEKLGLSA